MSNQFPSKRHKSFLENQNLVYLKLQNQFGLHPQNGTNHKELLDSLKPNALFAFNPDNKYTHFFLNNDAKNSIDNTNNTSNLLSNSNLNRSKNDTQDLNISNEDELQKEIENNLNLINETSSEDENFSSTLNNRNEANKDLKCNKDDFKNFFKILENSNNKNLSNYNNNDETDSVGSDCFGEFQDFNNHHNFNNFNQNSNNNYPDQNLNFNDNNYINPKKRHSHPVNNSNLNPTNNRNPNLLECSNSLNNNLLNSNEYNFINNHNNFNDNFAPNFSEQYYNISPNNSKPQQNSNLFYSSEQQVNNIQNFNLSNAAFKKNNSINSTFNINNNSCKNNNSSVSNFPNIPSCNNELRNNSLYTPYSQEESDNSMENFACNVNTNSTPFNNQIQENLIAFNNLNANRRKSFNCLNNNANILGQDLFSLSPKKRFLNQQQSRKSFIYPGCKNSANYFNINLMSATNNLNKTLERECYNINNNIGDGSIPYNNPMFDFLANNNNKSSIEHINNNGFNPAFYAMPGNNTTNNFCMNNFMANNMLNNDNGSYHSQGINYYKMQAQAASNIPVATACLYNNPIMNPNNVSNLNISLKNNNNSNISNCNYTNNINSNNNSNCPINNNKYISSAKTRTPIQNSKSNPQVISNNINSLKHGNSACGATGILHPNHLNNKKPNIAKNNCPIQANASGAQPDPNSIDENYIIENITIYLKDQNGCRLLQKKIEEKKYDLIMSFYEAVVKRPNFIEVVNDQFGNYVIQKFLEVIFKDKIIMTTFFEKIEPEIFDVSINLYGTRVFQKALDLLEKNYHFVENEKINEVFKRLVLDNMMELIVDTNGNHVFMKVIGIYPKNKNDFIFEELFKKSKEIAMLKQGGTVFQKAFEHGSKDQKDKLIFEILSYIKELINDEFGNFIVQQIVFMKNMEYNKIISDFICDNVLMLSQQKFSSNVIDKCILLEDAENNNYIRVNIINSIINKKIIGDLLIDQYGNYVVQKSLMKSEEENFNTLIQEIKNNLGLILSKPFGRKIYDNLVKNYSEYLGSLTSKQILNSQEDKYMHINQSIKKSKKNGNDKNTKN